MELETINDFNVLIKVRNNKLMKAIKLAGFKTLIEFSIKSEVSIACIYNYINLKRPAMINGNFAKAVIKMANTLNVNPFDLFPFKFIDNCISKNIIEKEFDEEQVDNLISNKETNPEVLMLVNERDKILKDLFKFLTPREERVIRLRFGLDNSEAKELSEIGEELNLSRERVRQIEGRALDKLRKRIKIDNLKSYFKGI